MFRVLYHRHIDFCVYILRFATLVLLPHLQKCHPSCINYSISPLVSALILPAALLTVISCRTLCGETVAPLKSKDKQARHDGAGGGRNRWLFPLQHKYIFHPFN